MDEKQAAELLEKYRAGTCTPEELRLVRRAFLGFPLADVPPASDADYDAWKSEAWTRLTERTQLKPRAIRWLPYAAAIVLVAAIAWLVISRQQSAVGTDLAGITPGGNRATLTLADGRVIDLDETQTGIVIGIEDITYTDGSTLAAVIPSVAEESLPNSVDGLMMLSLTTPKGGTYQITLPDGSKVWLNSASTLKYPSRFSGDSRDVILEGEAFFDIQEIQGKRAPASNADFPGARVSRVPFNVQTANQVVNVLGTQFNLSAYADDPETKTTLVQGKVRVVVSPAGEPVPTRREARVGSSVGRARPELASGGRFLELKPGQQAITRGASTTAHDVDVEQYASWRDGYFVLRGTIPELLKQLGRWYDIDVVYAGSPADSVDFYATLQRDVPLADLLDTWRHYDPKLQFSVEQITDGSTNKAGRRLTISRK